VRGRLEWAREECVALAAHDRRPRSRHGLRAAARAVNPRLTRSCARIARELVQWREETACAQDRPIPSVLSDAALIEVAKRLPARHEGARADPRHQTSRPCGAVAEPSSRPSNVAGSGRRSPSTAAGRPSTTRSNAPIIALAESLVRTRAARGGASPTSSSPRAPTCTRIVLAVRDDRPSCPTCARCRAGGARSSATSSIELLEGRRSADGGSGPARQGRTFLRRCRAYNDPDEIDIIAEDVDGNALLSIVQAGPWPKPDSQRRPPEAQARERTCGTRSRADGQRVPEPRRSRRGQSRSPNEVPPPAGAAQLLAQSGPGCRPRGGHAHREGTRRHGLARLTRRAAGSVRPRGGPAGDMRPAATSAAASAPFDELELEADRRGSHDERQRRPPGTSPRRRCAARRAPGDT